MQFSCSSCYSLPSSTLITISFLRLRGCQNVTKAQHISKKQESICTVLRAIERNLIKQILELVTFDPRRLRDCHIITSKRGS